MKKKIISQEKLSATSNNLIIGKLFIQDSKIATTFVT